MYFKYREPNVPPGTVSGKPTTASWPMTSRRSSGVGAAREVEARVQRARVRWWVRGAIVAVVIVVGEGG